MNHVGIAALCLVLLTSASCGTDDTAVNLQASATGVAAHQTGAVHITSMHQGWIPTGLSLLPGGEATIVATGNIEIGLPRPVEPKHTLWGRVGESGTIFQLASNYYSFVSEEAGQLYVAFSPSGLLWANRQGKWVEAFAQMPDAPLDIVIEAFAWNGSAAMGLADLLGTEDQKQLAEHALTVLKESKELPDGFDYLWYLSQSNVFSGFSEGDRKGVHAATAGDFGIIKKSVDIPLTEATLINFEWLYKHLPALQSETDPANHDYLSIAVEFDNGQDITWMWSKDIPIETSFTCPLPEWQHRETHIVLQNGMAGLGEWHSHTRSIQADYANAVGGKFPARIVGIWIIGVSVFGGQQAEAYFANAVITDGDLRYDLM